MSEITQQAHDLYRLLRRKVAFHPVDAEILMPEAEADIVTAIAAAVRGERSRCAKIVSKARFSGYTDLRSLVSMIEGGGDERD